MYFRDNSHAHVASHDPGCRYRLTIMTASTAETPCWAGLTVGRARSGAGGCRRTPRDGGCRCGTGGGPGGPAARRWRTRSPPGRGRRMTTGNRTRSSTPVTDRHTAIRWPPICPRSSAGRASPHARVRPPRTCTGRSRSADSPCCANQGDSSASNCATTYCRRPARLVERLVSSTRVVPGRANLSLLTGSWPAASCGLLNSALPPATDLPGPAARSP